MAYSPIKDKDKFVAEQESRTSQRPREEKEYLEKCERERIEKVLKEKEVRQCNEYLAKLRGHPDWYYWQDKIKLVESLEKGAIVEEQLYPGKRHKRNAERMRREEMERRQLEEVRLKTDIKIPERYKKISQVL